VGGKPLAQATPGDALSRASFRVFISYSRKDLDFGRRLVAALGARGIAAQIDERDLPDLEEWKRELSALIRAADALVFIISPRSIISPMCNWELAQATVLNKRLAPVVLEPVADDKIPAELAKIQYLFFNPPNDFEPQVDRLRAALLRDAGWIKEHTYIAERAHRWVQGGRLRDGLLRGRDLQEAKRWAFVRPKEAPFLTEQQKELLTTSQFSPPPLNLTGPVAIVSIILGSLSVVSLIKRGLELTSFVWLLQRVLDYYEATIHELLGSWAEPLLKKLIAYIHILLGWRLTLDTNWKHVFVLMMLFFGAVYRQMAGADRKVALVLLALGITTSVVISVFVGVMPMPHEGNEPVYILLNALIPGLPLIAAFAFFAMTSIWYSVFRARLDEIHWWRVFILRPAVLPALLSIMVVVSTFVAWVAGLIGNFRTEILLVLPLLRLPRPLAIGSGFVGVATILLAWAASNAFPYSRERRTTWLHEFKLNLWTSVAVSMFLVMLGALLFLLVNAVAGFATAA
jgi:hypothetical protein